MFETRKYDLESERFNFSEREAEKFDSTFKQPLCTHCNDTGIYSKTEWVGTDTSYEVEKKCICQED